MDWIEDFILKFKTYPEVRYLKRDRFHGWVSINFCNGVPSTYDFKLHRRAVNTKTDSKTKTMDWKQEGQP